MSMRPDIVDLQAFYGCRQGQLVRRLVGREIRSIWPDLAGARLLGIGYAVPFLAPLSEAAERVCVVMPPAQGVVQWPPDRPNQVVLAADDELPLADRSVDRVLMVHALEATEQSQRLLREIWRVLADGGQALIVVPNRRGLWCLSDSTPFGHGRPFSAAQLKQALHSNLFAPRRIGHALFVPPNRSRVMLRTAMVWERIGLRWAKTFAGVLLMAAEKQIYAVPAEPALKRARVPAYVPVPRALAAAERVAETTPATTGRPPARVGSARTAPAR
jgi:SAM-dependent methyltransferase